MTALTDKELATFGLLPDAITGFRTAMKYPAKRAPGTLPMPETLLSPARAAKHREFQRGITIAHAWRNLRTAAATARRSQNTPSGLFPQNSRRQKSKEAIEHLIAANAAADGFGSLNPSLIWHIATRVTLGDIGYYENEVITFFHADGPNGILAPTHPTQIIHNNQLWTSVEALYQSQKHSDPAFREKIRLAPDALAAKEIAHTQRGDLLHMQNHFAVGRRLAMTRAISLRAQQDRHFRNALVETDGKDLVEKPEGPKLDTRWGAIGRGGLRGWNLQGRLLVAVRTAILEHTLITEEVSR